MKKTLLTLIGALIALPTFARDFQYTYEGQTITYTVIDEEAKTVKTREGSKTNTPDKITGDLILPSAVYDGDTRYSLIEIGEGAFYECNSLISVFIPNSVTSIGEDAFFGCSGLTSVTIPNAIIIINDNTFRRCSSLTSVTIPNSVKAIGKYAFEKCSSLTSFIIGNSITSIGESAFRLCTNMTSLSIGNSVTEIGDYAFEECSNLTSVTLPNSVKSIGLCAFMQCNSLTSVTIPGSVTEILTAFPNCENLSAINVDPSNTSFTSVTGVLYNKDLTKIIQYPAGKKQQVFIIPNSVTEIGAFVFSGCQHLTSITIPNSINQEIGDKTFWGCSGLTSVTYLAEKPITSHSRIFDEETYQNATLNYLKSAEEKIASTEPWSRFVNRIGRDADYKEEGAISEVQATDSGATAVYDMRGVKVGTSTSGLQRGIYIANGRKIFVR